MKCVKGSRCSREGVKYEREIYEICKRCIYNGHRFNTQLNNKLGGCSSDNDIICNNIDKYDLPIEIKKLNTPDWMQCSLKYNNNKWQGSENNKIPYLSKKLFENIINDISLFNGNIPPFMIKDITYDEWIQIKKETNDYNDIYLNCSSDMIKNLYREKGCYYIQISEKGLYHLGNDICNFNVPEFICDQEIRIRIKVHTRCNTKGYCKLSVTASCKPKNIKLLNKSNYSLDNVKRLPLNLQMMR